MKYVVYIIVILAVIFAVDYGLKKQQNPYTKPPVDEIMGTSWIMSGLADEDSDTEESVLALNLQLSFDADKGLSGKICNSFSGKYQENGPSLKVPNLVSTKIACNGVLNGIEQKFFSSLTNGITYSLEEGGLLVITDTNTGRRFFFSSENQ